MNEQQIKDERIEKIAEILKSCCCDHVEVIGISLGYGAVFQLTYLQTQQKITYSLTDEQMYIGRKRAKYSDYYVIGEGLREKLGIPKNSMVSSISFPR